MKIKCTSFDQMAYDIISNELSIVSFGCGVIGRITVVQLARQYHILDYFRAYVDNDSRLWGKCIDLGKKNVPIYDPDKYFKDEVVGDIVLLLSASRYEEIIDQLETYSSLSDVTCYLIPMMCVNNFTGLDSIGVVKDSIDPIIPKKIHYIWLGGREIPYNLKKCIRTWKIYCPDYEIIRWDESNYDFYSVPYMKEAMECKAYGFVPDYARLDIIYKYGGFYLDTDVELIRPLDELRYQEAFCGVEAWQTLNVGGGMGAVSGNEMIGQLLDNRRNLHFVNKDDTRNLATCGYYDTQVAIKNGYKMTGEIQKIGDMNIYPKEYFHPFDYMSGRTTITPNTFSIHRFKGGWMTPEMRTQNLRVQEHFEKFCKKVIAQ